MENILVSSNAILPLFIIIIIGYILKKFKFYTDEAVSIFNKVVFKIFLPLHLFNSIYKNKLEVSGLDTKYVLYVVLSIIIIFVCSTLVVSYYEKDNKRKSVIIQCLFRSNFVIMGFPIINSIYGDAGVSTVAVLTAVVIPLFNILAVLSFNLFYEKKMEITKVIIDILKNPLIIGIVLGGLFSFFDIKIVDFLNKSLIEMGKIATPLAILLLGASFKEQSIKSNITRNLNIVILKLVIIPLVFISIGVVFGFRGVELLVAYIIFGGPIAVTTFTMAEVMGGDGELAGQMVILTTACSIISMFIGILIMKNFNLL